MKSAAPPSKTRSSIRKKRAPRKDRGAGSEEPVLAQPAQQTIHLVMPAIPLGGHGQGAKTTFSRDERSYLEKLAPREREQLMSKVQEPDVTPETPLRFRLAKSGLPNKSDLMRRLTEHEGQKFEQYVRTALDVPVRTYSAPPACDMNTFLRTALTNLDAEIYGQSEIKDETIRALCSWKTNSTAAPTIIGLEGPPGVGKTSYAKALGKIMGRPLAFISLGGMNDVSVLMGHSYTYESSSHGMLAQTLINCKSNTPVIVFDEVDKIPPDSSRAQEIISLLIHLTDPASNHDVRDRYLGGKIPLDFSRACFVFTMNDSRRVSSVLVDRMKLMLMQTPDFDDKLNIAQMFLIPREVKRVGSDVRISEDAVRDLVKQHSPGESGVRGLSRAIRRLVETLNVLGQGGAQFLRGLAANVADGESGICSVELARLILHEDRDKHDKASLSHSMMYC